MNIPARGQSEEQRRELERAIQEFERQSSELFQSSEERFCVPNKNGLSVWVGVKSVRAKDRLETVQRLVFRQFSAEARYIDSERVEWVHFGFFHPSKRPEKVGGFVRFVDAA
jgi:hypothetical protein